MDFNANLRREASGELTFKPSPEAAALATAYWKNPTPGRSWPVARVKEEVVAAAGGDTGDRNLVLSERALQFGQYRGKTFKWLCSNDVGYVAMVLASHQQERERGDRSTSAVMGNKDALLQYVALFPDVMEAIQERRVREGAGTPAQEDALLVSFGKYASQTFNQLYDSRDKEIKGTPGLALRWRLQKYIKIGDTDKLPPNLPGMAPQVNSLTPEPSLRGESWLSSTLLSVYAKDIMYGHGCQK
ncbi:hypothetical protein IRJ41_022032 [Triplophysa rosa]|uniref:Uncharacterized protein n=1 Tax=Triplophysa rosa TaxID=992332 RepID=A0A9W7TJ48_TRIRA|nr:hypothetical protein IRJ41_022032 [Triplophysa rosa]